jgi:hypothetical protein
MTQGEIIINKIAQDKLDFDQGLIWFDALDDEQKIEAINNLCMFIQQAHPTKEFVDLGLELAPIKKTMTPVVIFRRQNLKTALNKIRGLPQDEWKKAFVTMLSVFKVADTKRREIWCKDGCSHDWHNLGTI